MCEGNPLGTNRTNGCQCECDAFYEGNDVGTSVGKGVGFFVGVGVGVLDGDGVGIAVGEGVGIFVGDDVGCSVGGNDGTSVGDDDGNKVGFLVGLKKYFDINLTNVCGNSFRNDRSNMSFHTVYVRALNDLYRVLPLRNHTE